MKYLKRFNTKESGDKTLQPTPIICTVKGVRNIVLAGKKEFPDGVEVVATEDFITVKEIPKWFDTTIWKENNMWEIF